MPPDRPEDPAAVHVDDHCPVDRCRMPLGVDPRMFRHARPERRLLVCPRCRSVLEPVYDAFGPSDGFWFFDVTGTPPWLDD